MIPSVVAVDDITYGQGVYRKENGAQDRALGDATGKRVEHQFYSRYGNTLGPIREIGLQPIKWRAREAESGVQVVQEDGVIN